MRVETISAGGNGGVKVGIVGSLHGNEKLGARVIDMLRRMKMPKGVGVIGIIANTEAMKHNKRFLDVDGNRCFPGSPNGNSEERMAHNVLEALKGCDYVIDIHSTYASQPDTIISTKESSAKLLEHIPIRKVLVMGDAIASGRALIDHVRCGVSIEFSRKKSTRYVAQKVALTIWALAQGKRYKDKEVYKVIGFFGEKGKDYGFRNFKPVESADVKKKFGLDTPDKLFPVFIGEKGYGPYCMMAVPLTRRA